MLYGSRLQQLDERRERRVTRPNRRRSDREREHRFDVGRHRIQRREQRRPPPRRLARSLEQSRELVAHDREVAVEVERVAIRRHRAVEVARTQRATSPNSLSTSARAGASRRALRSSSSAAPGSPASARARQRRAAAPPRRPASTFSSASASDARLAPRGPSASSARVSPASSRRIAPAPSRARSR